MKLALDALPRPRKAPEDCPFFFWNGVTSERALVGIAERALAAVFKKSGVPNAHAHRFRHTLATRLVGEGYSYELVADILGNSPSVVRKHYAKWSKGRQDNIDRGDALVSPGWRRYNSSHTSVTLRKGGPLRQ